MILKVCNNKASRHMKEQLAELKGKRDKFTVILGEFDNSYKKTKKISKNVNSTIE